MKLNNLIHIKKGKIPHTFSVSTMEFDINQIENGRFPNPKNRHSINV